MEIFSRLFGTTSDIQNQLESLYVPILQMMNGMTLSQAKSTFHDLYKQAENEANAEDSINLPINLGDFLLEKETTDKKIKSRLAKKRSEGVRDEDIKWWWNRHELDRKMMIKVDDICKLAMYIQLREEYHLIEEGVAAKEVKKYFPIYGDPDDTSTSAGDDRSLPFEIKDRINIYIQKRAQTDPEKYKKEIAESSSFNALIRKEIRKGNV